MVPLIPLSGIRRPLLTREDAELPRSAHSGYSDGAVLLTLHQCDAEASPGDSQEELERSQHELRRLASRLLSVQEQERKRIAAELHEGIGQSLGLMTHSLDSVTQRIAAGAQQEAAALLEQMIGAAKDAMADLRRTAMALRPSMLDDLGIVPTLSWFFREFESNWRDVTVEKDVTVAESEVPVTLKPAIFRILQEATSNIVRHARADWIRISLSANDGILRLLIEDNGPGLHEHELLPHRASDRGAGLLTMQERARASNGCFELSSGPGRGTQIRFAWQLSDGACGAFSRCHDAADTGR